MEKFGQKLWTNLFCFSLIILTFGTIVEADSVVEDINLNPKNPAPLSSVTFSVDISNNQVTSAWIVVSECNKEKGICHAPPQNVSLTKVGGNTYEKSVNLMWDDVTSITYKVVINKNGEWISSEDYTSALSTDSGNSDDSNGSPGFEILIFFIAIIGVIVIFKKNN